MAYRRLPLAVVLRAQACSWGTQATESCALRTLISAEQLSLRRRSTSPSADPAAGGPPRATPPSPAAVVVVTQQAGHGTQERLVLTLVGGEASAKHYQQAAAQNAKLPWSMAALRAALQRQLAATFLPAGYPASVAPGYLRYVWWQALHHFAGSVNGVLASSFLLYSVGLGAGAIPTAGALNWVLKDGLGQLGTLLFGKAIAHSFDVNSRAWYLAASTKLNVAMGLEVCTLMAPHLFLPIGALANAVKGLAWMSGGSARSAFNVAFASHSNIADITAKATSQTICTTMAGTAAGAALAAHVGQDLAPALASFAAVAALHMYTSYTSVRCVPLGTLNPTRLQLLIGQHLQQLQEQWRLQQQQEQPRPAPPSLSPPQQQQQQQQRSAEPKGWDSRQQLGMPGEQQAPQWQWSAEAMQANDLLSSPHAMAALEPILATPAWHEHSGLPRLHIGNSLAELHRRAPALVAALLPLFAHRRHVLIPGASGVRGSRSSRASRDVHLVFHEEASAQDCTLGVLHAHLLAAAMHGGLGGGAGAGPDSGGASTPDGVAAAAAAVRNSLGAAESALPGLLAALAASGWDSNRVLLETRIRRARW